MLLRLIDGLLSCVALSVVLSVIAPQPALAGGPRYVAGVSYFDPTTKGTPLTGSQMRFSGRVQATRDPASTMQHSAASIISALTAICCTHWSSSTETAHKLLINSPT